MERTITVKGTGKVTIKPDLTVVSLTLRSLDPDYDASVADAAHRLDAMRTALGELLSIRYHWGERDFFSTTEYGMEKRCMSMANGAGMEIMPDDITVDDNAAFVWAIL